MDTEKELLKRLRELEAENQRLKVKGGAATKNSLIVTEGDYKGHPTLSFEGPCRRFTLGIAKLRALDEAWPHVQQFLKKHAGQKTSIEEDDCKL